MSSTVIIIRQAELERALADRCLAAGYHVLLVPPLYHLPEDSPCWEELRALQDRFVIVSRLYPRPVEWLLKRHGIVPPVTVLHLDADGEVTDILSAVQDALPAGNEPGTQREIADDISERWYPIIDRSRCVNCHHCLQFCLFGVYIADAGGQVVAENPDRCKPGCPACSRICPHGAIIFPLYARDPAIAGAPGLFMTPDLAARKMFYTRTKQPCPQCGGTPENQSASNASPGTPLCQECGRPLPGDAQPPVQPAFDDIDALIDDLDRLAKGRG